MIDGIKKQLKWVLLEHSAISLLIIYRQVVRGWANYNNDCFYECEVCPYIIKKIFSYMSIKIKLRVQFGYVF